MFHLSGVNPEACDGVIWNKEAHLPSSLATGTHHMEALVSYRANRCGKKFLGPVWGKGLPEAELESLASTSPKPTLKLI